MLLRVHLKSVSTVMMIQRGGGLELDNVDPKDILPDVFFEDFYDSDTKEGIKGAEELTQAATAEYVSLTNAYGSPIKTQNLAHWTVNPDSIDDEGKITITMATSERGLETLIDNIHRSEDGDTPLEVSWAQLKEKPEGVSASGLCVKTQQKGAKSNTIMSKLG